MAHSLLARLPLYHLPARWQCDLADGSLLWTSGVYGLFGLPPGTRLFRPDIVRMYAPESRNLLERLRSAAIADCTSFTFEAEICRPDGAVRRMLLSADVECRNGHPVSLYGTKIDVTPD